MNANHDTTATNTSQAADEKQREADGKFSKGNKGGPGNPFARQMAQLRKAAMDAVSEDDIRDVLAALKEKAKAGDVAAAKLLLSYSVGKPAPAPDPDKLDQEELQTIADNHVRQPQQLLDIVNGMPIDMLLVMIRAMLPALEKSKMELAKQVLTAPQESEEEDEEDETAEMPPLPPAEIPDWMWEIVKDQGAPGAPATGTSESKTVLDKLTQLQQQLAAFMQDKNATGGAHPGAEDQPMTNGSNRSSQPPSATRNGTVHTSS